MAGQNLVGDSYTDENLKSLQAKIDKANESLKNFNTTSATDDELRKRAESEYTPIYNAQVTEQQAAKNSAQSTLEGSLSALERQYGRDSEELGRSYDTQLASANNQMLARGFNNSSLAVALGNYINTQRNRALENLAAERTAAENSARATYNNAVTAADANIARLGSDLATNVDARYSALKEAEQNRVYQQIQAQNTLEQYKTDLMLQMEQLRQQAMNQYYSMYGAGGSSSGGSGGGGAASTGSTATTASTTASATPSSSLGDKFNKSNQGSGAVSSAVKSAVSGVRSGVSGALSALSGLMNRVSAAKSSSTTAPNKKKTFTSAIKK